MTNEIKVILSCGTVCCSVQCGSSLSLWMKSSSATIQMEATKQYSPVVLFVVGLELLKSRDQILKCDYSNDNYPAVCLRVHSFETVLAFLTPVQE